MTEKGMFTAFVDGEGRDHLDACMEATFRHCHETGIDTVVIYTANGIGACLAVERYRSRPEFANTRLVAVTPPANKPYMENPRAKRGPDNTVQTGIFGDRRKQLIEARVPIVSARLPFRSPITPTVATKEIPPLDPMQIVDRAFGILGGGFSLCVQAVMMACDAGYVASGQIVAAMSADTAIVAYASQTESFLSRKKGLLVLHTICKPAAYTITKFDHEYTQRPTEDDVSNQVPLPLQPSGVIATTSTEPPAEGAVSTTNDTDADEASDDSEGE